MVVMIAPEMINNQKFATPRSNAQSMVNGEAGDLTAHAVLLVNQELNSEPESALVLFMVENIALVMTNNQKFATPTSNAQSMVNGEVGDRTAHAVLLVNQEHTSEPESALVLFMVENIALEMTNNQRLVIQMLNAQSMVNGEAGDLTARAVLLVNQELTSEHANVKEHYMVENPVQETTNNQRFATPRSTVQSMVNGQAGDLTAHAVLHVNQELTSEPESALVLFMVERNALEMTNNQKFVIQVLNVQSMVNGPHGPLIQPAVYHVAKEHKLD